MTGIFRDMCRLNSASFMNDWAGGGPEMGEMASSTIPCSASWASSIFVFFGARSIVWCDRMVMRFRCAKSRAIDDQGIQFESTYLWPQSGVALKKV